MAINKIGPREIYHYAWGNDTKDDEVDEFCEDDSPSCIEKFEKFYQAGGAKEFSNGGHTYLKNILMLAAANHNVHLVKYITERADQKLLNMRDQRGLSALFHAVFHKRGPTEKVIACVQMLIKAGANVNARRSTHDEEILLPLLLPPPDSSLDDPSLDEKYYHGENCLGFLARKLSYSKLDPRDKKRYELLTQLFLANGAKGHSECGACDGYYGHHGWFSAEDGVNEQDTSECAILGRILKKQADKILDWPRTRLLFLGIKNENSNLSRLPPDLVKMVSEKITLMHLENQE